VYDPSYATSSAGADSDSDDGNGNGGGGGGGPWRLWYGNLGEGGQYLLYANSSDGIAWDKPDLGRYDLRPKWEKRRPDVAKFGKHNNVVLFGGGLGIYRDTHEPNPRLRYKISGGAPAGCYSADGAEDCVIGTAGSPDGIGDWGDVRALDFAPPWRPDCHTNVIYDAPLGAYLMTTRNYVEPGPGRVISIARTSDGPPPAVFRKNGTWKLLDTGKFPPTTEGASCTRPPRSFISGTAAAAAAAAAAASDPVGACAKQCLSTQSCRYFWVYTAGKDKGTCCLKTGVLSGPDKTPACTSCGGRFYEMGGAFVPGNATAKEDDFDKWGQPDVTMNGTLQHQLYSQITWRFYDIFLGIVMTFDAKDPAGQVHCMLSW
jgi:hypothetical protein